VKPSILTPHAQTLLDMRLAGRKIKDLQKWLKKEGIVVGHSTVADFVSQLLSKRERDLILDRITSGASQVREMEERFKDNPAPELESVIKLYRVLILQLSTSGQTDPELLKLADQLTNTVAQIVSAQTKARFKEREVTLAEQKAAESKKSEREKALEFCLDESKGTPAEDLFRQAFAALKQAKGGK
jgi:hypothetical protein